MRGYDFIIEDRKPVVVYDVSIEDIDERRSKAVEYDTMKRACYALGVGYNAMRGAILAKRRIFSTTLNKEVAVRYKKPS
jgi:hypothetical protein